jgi:hypothetical protein
LCKTFLPAIIEKIVEKIQHPVALIGCHTSEMPLPCCEYDLAVFASGDNCILRLSPDCWVEVAYFTGPLSDHIVSLYGMIVLKDDNKFVLGSAAKHISVEKYLKTLSAMGKKLLITSLFYQQRVQETKNPTLAAMWLKMAAYDFISGSLALSGIRPMPLHELEQARLDHRTKSAEGMHVALECIGTERATRSSIFRSISAIRELKSKQYDLALFMSKANYLLEKYMLADCYYYAGRVATKNLAGMANLYRTPYLKLIQLALDLSNDIHLIEKLQKDLARVCRRVLEI